LFAFQGSPAESLHCSAEGAAQLPAWLEGIEALLRDGRPSAEGLCTQGSAAAKALKIQIEQLAFGVAEDLLADLAAAPLKAFYLSFCILLAYSQNIQHDSICDQRITKTDLVLFFHCQSLQSILMHRNDVSIADAQIRKRDTDKKNVHNYFM